MSIRPNEKRMKSYPEKQGEKTRIGKSNNVKTSALVNDLNAL